MKGGSASRHKRGLTEATERNYKVTKSGDKRKKGRKHTRWYRTDASEWTKKEMSG